MQDDSTDEVIVDTSGLRHTTAVVRSLCNICLLINFVYICNLYAILVFYLVNFCLQLLILQSLEGDITIPGAAGSRSESSDREFDTLDEPVKDTIVRTFI